MLLCLDVGNSHIHGGVFDKQQLIFQFRYETPGSVTSDQIGVFFRAVLRENNVEYKQIKSIAVCSVVPAIEYSLRSAFLKYFNLTPFILNHETESELTINIANPQELGADRIATAIAAIHQYPQKNIIITDFGTATTFDVVNANKEYLGGAIIPGLHVSMESLNLKAAKLPQVQILKPEKVTGATTTSNIQSGLYYGHLGALHEICARITHEQFADNKPIIIGTGGFAQLYRSENIFDVIVPDLVLQGLRITCPEI